MKRDRRAHVTRAYNARLFEISEGFLVEMLAECQQVDLGVGGEVDLDTG